MPPSSEVVSLINLVMSPSSCHSICSLRSGALVASALAEHRVDAAGGDT